MKPSRATGVCSASDFGDPFLFPHSFDEQTGEFVFLKTARNLLAKASFLDGREAFWTQKKEIRVSQKEIRAWFEGQKGSEIQANLIFHTGFCCSTLLARCLDQEESCLALKEPGLLNAFSEARHFAISGKNQNSYLFNLNLSLALLSRKPRESEQTLIKTSNIDTVLLEDIRRLYPKAKIVFLFSDLKTFLISIAKGGKPRRDFTRRLFSHYLADFKTRDWYDPAFFGMAEEGVWKMSDLHIAAAVWALQMSYARKTCGRNVFWLNPETFLDSPLETLGRIQKFLGLAAKPQDFSRTNFQKTLSVHAKAPQFSYSPEKRATEIRAIEKYLSPVLPEVLAWGEKNFPLVEMNRPEKIAV